MSINLFEQGIQNLNFSFIEESGNSGVLLTDNFEQRPPSLASADVLFSLETAKTKFAADAVYFRYFEDGRSAVPQLYLFDFTEKILTEPEKSRIHIQMWNGNQVPAYLFIEKTSVSFFDTREKPREDIQNYAGEILRLTGSAIKEFNAQSFDTGLFWEEQDDKKHFKFEHSATKDLIRGLKEVYKSFQIKSNLNRHVALKLLVQCLLIKYLEERDEDSKSGYFAGTYFKRNFQCDNFCDTIRKGKLLNLLDQLGRDFNGKIFDWDRKSEEQERIAIQQTEVTGLADYLDGNIQDSQYVLWRLYSFSHLPVEVISSVYEELLTDSKDIVYTPEMIVSTLVDECMPLKSPKVNFKLIDVSCGSGIFLVKAYKRIVQWWRYEQWVKTGKLVKPSLSVLRELLLTSIYGIDIQPDAISLSVFSLALGILDEVNLDPPTWGKLKFPDLSENVIVRDFFKYASSNTTRSDFNLVIGNPPFNLAPIDGKEPARKEYFKYLKKETGYQSVASIPDESPALHFLFKSMELLQENALLCLIQPSVPLLYQKDKAFRREVFSRYNLLQVIDFTKLSDKLWGDRTIATAAVFLQNSRPDTDDVVHVIANRTFSNTNRLFLEFDHYDFHVVSKESVLDNPYVWKANLLGGGRIGQLLERLSQMRTLSKFLESRKIEGWVRGEGFIENKAGKPGLHITGKRFVPASAIAETGLDESQITICNIEKFHRPTNELIYTPPHLLLRANIGKKGLMVHFSEDYLVFRNKIIGIHAPFQYVEELKSLHDYFKKHGKLLRFAILSTSSQIKVNRHSVPMTEDFMDLPYPEDIRSLNVSEVEDILINDVLEYQISNASALSKELTASSLQSFSETFCKTLNTIYQSDGKSFQLFKILDVGKYFALHFEYSSDNIQYLTEQTDDLESYIMEIIPGSNEKTQGVHIQRILKIYGRDCIIMVKPKQQRYWLRSVALRDADETFSDYVKARYYA